ncbi:MAG: hypothetical protein ACOC4B_03135 [Bacteroidota bacterium]
MAVPYKSLSFFQRTSKTFAKYIASGMDLVQHEILARSFRPLRFLYIEARQIYDALEYKYTPYFMKKSVVPEK